MSDPLTLLRNFTVSNKKVQVDGEEFIFDSLSCKRNVETSYKHKNKRKYYTLESVWFLLENESLSHSNYVIQASKAGISAVQLIDRKPLLLYLHGKGEGNLDPNKSAGTLTSLHKRCIASATSGVQDGEISGLSKKSKDEQEAAGTKENKIKIIENQQQQLNIDNNNTVTIPPPSDRSKDSIKPLSDKLNAQKIAELKARARQNKSHIGDDVVIGNNHLTLADAENMKQISKCERLVSTRDSILLSKNKRFDSVLKILHKVTQQDADEKKKKSYDRYDINEDTFLADKGLATHELGIDTRGSHMNDVPQYTEEMDNHTTTSNSTNSTSGGSFSSKSKVNQQGQPLRKDSRIPIVLVPAATSSLITIYNVKEFLESGNYISSSDAKKRNVQRPSMITINRKKKFCSASKNPDHSNDKESDYEDEAIFHVYDQTSKFSKSQWDRVVAIFIYGKEWQFKKFPFNGNVTHILNKWPGFYLAYDDPLWAVPENIQKWNVCKLGIKKHSRSFDITIVKGFWDKLDQFYSHKTNTMRIK